MDAGGGRGVGSHAKGLGKKPRSDAAAGAEAGPPAKVSRCPPSSSSVLASTECTAHQAAPLCMTPRNTGPGPAAVTIELFVELIKLAVTIPVSTEVERILATSFLVMGSAQNSQRILISHKDIAAIRSERNRNHIKAKTDENTI